MSFINTTKYADDATLVALYSNTWRTEHTITHDTKDQLKGSVSFNRIHPGNEHNGIKNFYLEMTGTFTITTRAANTPLRIQNINDCIYDCNVSYNGNSGYVNQPYLNSIIKRCFDEDVFIEQAASRHDKYVDAVISYNSAGTEITVKYHCMTPLYHEFFDTKEITGLNDLSIRFNYNLYNLFKVNMTNAAAGDPITDVALPAGTELKWRILYDEVAHDIPAEQYTMQIPHFAYYEAQNDFTVDSSATSTNTFNINVRDVMTCPLRCYLIAAPRIREEEVALCNVIPLRFIGSRWDIDGKKLNAFQSDGNDQLMSNFVNSRNAGLKSEFMTWAGRKGDSITSDGIPIDPIIGITTLGTTNTYVSTAENWRLQVKGTIEHDQLTNCTKDRTLQGIVVYEYPAVLSLSSVASSTTGIIYSLNGTHDQLIEIEMDDNDYLKSLEEAGLLVGGSKIGDFFKNAWKKIKSSKFISKALNWIGNDSKKYNSLLSMIPVVGQFVPQIQDIASKAAPMVESAGLGVNLF